MASDARAIHATLSGTTVSSDTLSGLGYDWIEIINRVGATTLYVTKADNNQTPTTPTAAGAGTIAVPASTAVRVRGGIGPLNFKTIGNANEYTISEASS